VSIESVDRRYYHVAFFASRIINPGEELTWDYGTDFSKEDPDLPKFSCKCKSAKCRDGTVPLAVRKPPRTPRRSR
jgi:SET domain-containing protein